MKNNYTIHIPTPCHENWNAMAPVEQGRFCQSCAKQVVDFSMMTDQEVLNYFNTSTGNTCGRFNNDQLQRPLQPTKIEKKKAWWVAAMMPLLLVFAKPKAQSKDSTGNRIEISIKPSVMGEVSYSKPVKQSPKEIRIKRSKGDEAFTLAGRIVEADAKTPVPFALVSVGDNKTAADAEGNFVIHGRTNKPVLKLNTVAIGFEVRELKIIVQDTIPVDVTNTLKGDTIINTTSNHNATVPVFKNDKRFVIPEIPAIHDEGTTSLQSQLTNSLQGTVGKYVCYKPPVKTDTIPAFIQNVFRADAFKVYPNPAQSGSHVTVEVKNEGSYSIQLYGNNANLIMATPFEAVKGATQTNITIPAGLTPGMYYIQLFDNKKKKQYTSKLTVM